MKRSRSATRSKAHAIPAIRFESQQLTSFGGLVIFQRLFDHLQLKAHLDRCFVHLKKGKIFSYGRIVLQLMVHLLLGFRELRDVRYYQDDPLVKRVLGLRTLPSVSSLSRALRGADERSVGRLRALLRRMVLDRIASLGLARITLDFDGSVLSTSRSAEGAAVGFNKKKKGARSYYPLFCTIAQSGQVFDFLHRPGNVHDSKGARLFILACIEAVQRALPATHIEVRMDSAFFSDEIVTALDQKGIDFTISVPFERFSELKRWIEARQRWRRAGSERSYFEAPWKPKCWQRSYRFVFVRTRVRKQHKGPIQLDLFIPHEHGYDFKVVVTNKTTNPRQVIAFHEGRGAQEGIFGDLKSQCRMGYVPVRTCLGNQIYLTAGLLAHNLSRELQMLTHPKERGTNFKRSALWPFEKLETLRHNLLRRAGRLTRPAGILTLTLSATGRIKDHFLDYFQALARAA